MAFEHHGRKPYEFMWFLVLLNNFPLPYCIPYQHTFPPHPPIAVTEPPPPGPPLPLLFVVSGSLAGRSRTESVSDWISNGNLMTLGSWQAGAGSSQFLFELFNIESFLNFGRPYLDRARLY